ncbi:MFS transporter [Mycolicibacterium smegmatis]|uniref:Putative proline/betaine transporter n=3 Tax=Mycolicibacterium smegmatis TaxID=1772 RepID=I7G6R4_MYCS2|nr:MFS transporter [Mycolicibacterium smegmatis]ABK70381.1 major facilitator superfamily protein [Mycolicibacterium smegmatis MC2 155]AFP41367.1 Major facilitator superfamily MFS_1 [Mycolicibacterium smegmatis MC2 155]AIU10088.1 major facilitator transporter [Mycolicibacterium smegmatis MC2 155]AIU16713.1 major facilitator transporter [Mycolicibacterium smegmatis]AIU23336.1 major facilitator transporter [Mycolicibacterium smegmatis]
MTVTADLVDEQPNTPDEKKTVRTAVLASVVGTTIEWYDFFLYATAASLVFNHAFFPDQSSFVGTMLAFATFAVGFVVRPIGGFVFGHVGDRIGRKKTLALTMLLMGVATALMGFLPTAAQIGVLAPILLLVLRIVQGFALGGEWAGAVLLAVEHSPRNRRGLFGSIPQVGLALGLALGTAVFVVLQVALTPEAFLSYGWRIAFLVSIVLVIFGVVVRFRVAETPAFEQVQRENDRAAVPVRDVFRPPVLRSTILGLLSRWGEGAAFNTWGVFTIAYATTTLGLDKVAVLIVVTVAALLMAVLLPVSGALADRFSPRTVYAAGIAAYGVIVFPAFALFNTGSIAAYAVGMILAFGVIHALFYGAQGTLYASLFPTRSRYTGLSTVYQLSGVYASGLTPLILTSLIAAGGGKPWYACGYLVATAVISVVATLLLRPEH